MKLTRVKTLAAVTGSIAAVAIGVFGAAGAADPASGAGIRSVADDMTAGETATSTTTSTTTSFTSSASPEVKASIPPPP